MIWEPKRKSKERLGTRTAEGLAIGVFHEPDVSVRLLDGVKVVFSKSSVLGETVLYRSWLSSSSVTCIVISDTES